MYCEHCGSLISDNAKFCTECGAPVRRKPNPPKTAPIVEEGNSGYYSAPSVCSTPEQQSGFTFVTALVAFFTKYIDFESRSRRSEYWWVFLDLCIISGILGAIGSTALATIWSVATFIPNLAVTVRRLHDAGKSGWYLCWYLLPVVGWIIVLIQLLKDSESGDNNWGPSPKY